jgi:hypothetical protein
MNAFTSALRTWREGSLMPMKMHMGRDERQLTTLPVPPNRTSYCR